MHEEESCCSIQEPLHVGQAASSADFYPVMETAILCHKIWSVLQYYVTKYGRLQYYVTANYGRLQKYVTANYGELSHYGLSHMVLL